VSKNPKKIADPLDGRTVRINRDLRAFPGDTELSAHAGKVAQITRFSAESDLYRASIDGEYVETLRLTDFTVLAEEASAPEFLVAAPELAIHSLTNPRRRKGLDLDSIRALAESIKVHGLAQPILVRKLPAARLEDTSALSPRPIYEVIAGERRWRACMHAGLESMPMMLRDLDDQAVLEMQLVENVEREDLDAMEEAEGYELLRTQLGYTIEQIAERVGKGKGASYIGKTLKLCALTPESREAMYSGVLGRSTGLLVARYPAEEQADVVEFIAEHATDGEPAPFRVVAPLVKRRFNLMLSSAMFDLSDAMLVPAAGSCDDCPKRTGHQAEIFGDTGDDTCMDATCFDGKREAHLEAKRAKAREQAEREGLKVIDGDEARRARIFPQSKVIEGFVRLDDVSHRQLGNDDVQRDVTVADALRALGKKAPKPRVFIDPHTGEATKVITIELANSLAPKGEPAEPGRAKGKAVSAAPALPPKTSPEQDAMELPGVQRAMFIRLFEAIRADKERRPGELAHVAASIFGHGERIEHVEDYLGWAQELEDCDECDHAQLVYEKVELLPEREVADIIVMAALERYVTYYMVTDTEALALFKRYGIDAIAVRDKVAEDLERAEEAGEVDA